MKNIKSIGGMLIFGLLALSLVLTGCRITVRLGTESTAGITTDSLLLSDTEVSTAVPETIETYETVVTVATVETIETTTVPLTSKASSVSTEIPVPVTTEKLLTVRNLEPYDFTGDGVMDTLQLVYGTENTTVILNDTKTEKRYVLVDDLSYVNNAVKFEKTEWGWIAYVGGETIYIRTDDLHIDEPLYEFPKIVISRPYSISCGGYNNESNAMTRTYELYISESTIIGAICEIYDFEDGKFIPVAWKYGESPSMTGPRYPKHSDAYLYSFLPKGATAAIVTGSPVGSVPKVISYATDGKEPLLYYTYDNGTTWLPLSVKIPESLSYDRARVVDIVGGNSLELYLYVELQNGLEKEYYTVMYEYSGGYADGRFCVDDFAGYWKANPDPSYYYDFTGDGFVDELQIHNDWYSISDGKNEYEVYSGESDARFACEKFSATPYENGWKIDVDGVTSYVITEAFAKDEILHSSPWMSHTPYYVTEYSDDVKSDFYTGDYSLKRCYDIYLGENSICGAICETLTFQDDEFVPTKWEFIYSPHSTIVPAAEWSKNYPETFLPDGATAIICSGSVLGSACTTFISYEVSGSAPAFFMAEGYGAIYIPVELDLPEASDAVRVVDSIRGNSTEIYFIVSGEKTYRVDCVVYGYFWQSKLILCTAQEMISES